MKKINLHILIIQSVVMLFLFFVCNNTWDYECYTNLYNSVITFYILYHIGYIVFNKRDFMMTTQRLRNEYRDYNLRYKSQVKENGKIHKIFVNNYVDDFWYELDYMLTIPQDSNVDVYNDFIEKNDTTHKLYSTMITKRKNDKQIMKDYLFNKTLYNTNRYTALAMLILITFITFAIMVKKNMLF